MIGSKTSPPQLEFDTWMAQAIDQVQSALNAELPSVDVTPAYLHEAMRYASLNGGKRVRALLVYASAHAVGSSLAENTTIALNNAACAVELIHAYSLVHDDLPCMDNDVLRRGQPTTHVKFGQAMALLAGDALQPLAFELLANMPVNAAAVTQAIKTLSFAAGSLGMAGGQAIDLHHVNQSMELATLRQMHSMKTGAMILASVQLGAIVADATIEQMQAIKNYGNAIGLAFQVVDDILDVTADTQMLGKTAGKDAQSNKPTYVNILGLEQAQLLAQQLEDQAILALQVLADSGGSSKISNINYLVQIAKLITSRSS